MQAVAEKPFMQFPDSSLATCALSKGNEILMETCLPLKDQNPE